MINRAEAIQILVEKANITDANYTDKDIACPADREYGIYLTNTSAGVGTLQSSPDGVEWFDEITGITASGTFTQKDPMQSIRFKPDSGTWTLKRLLNVR